MGRCLALQVAPLSTAGFCDFLSLFVILVTFPLPGQYEWNINKVKYSAKAVWTAYLITKLVNIIAILGTSFTDYFHWVSPYFRHRKRQIYYFGKLRKWNILLWSMYPTDQLIVHYSRTEQKPNYFTKNCTFITTYYCML